MVLKVKIYNHDQDLAIAQGGRSVSGVKGSWWAGCCLADPGDDDEDGDDLYIIGAVCMYVCDEKVTSSLICSATVAGEIYI